MIVILDKEIEKLWQEFEDVPVLDDEDGMVVIDCDWHEFERGTQIEEIWYWFDEHHSKGVGWLMNGRNQDA